MSMQEASGNLNLHSKNTLLQISSFVYQRAVVNSSQVCCRPRHKRFFGKGNPYYYQFGQKEPLKSECAKYICLKKGI